MQRVPKGVFTTSNPVHTSSSPYRREPIWLHSVQKGVYKQKKARPSSLWTHQRVTVSLWCLKSPFQEKGSLNRHLQIHEPLVRYVKLWVAHAAGMPETSSLPPRVRDPDMHHVTCVTHVPWCMPGSSTTLIARFMGPHVGHTNLALWVAYSFEVGGGGNVPGIPGACPTRNFAYLVRGPYRKETNLLGSMQQTVYKQDI